MVDTGPWIFGKKVLLPAGAIDRIDVEEERIYVVVRRIRSRTLPSSTNRRSETTRYRSEVGSYYGSGGGGFTP